MSRLNFFGTLQKLHGKGTIYKEHTEIATTRLTQPRGRVSDNHGN